MLVGYELQTSNSFFPVDPQICYSCPFHTASLIRVEYSPRRFLTPQLPRRTFTLSPHTHSLGPYSTGLRLQEKTGVLPFTPAPEQGWLFSRVWPFAGVDQG